LGTFVFFVDETGKGQQGCRGKSYPGVTTCFGIESFIACAYPGLRLEMIPANGSESCKKHNKNNLPLLYV
jgi:hypothetical protein